MNACYLQVIWASALALARMNPNIYKYWIFGESILLVVDTGSNRTPKYYTIFYY